MKKLKMIILAALGCSFLFMAASCASSPMGNFTFGGEEPAMLSAYKKIEALSLPQGTIIASSYYEEEIIGIRTNEGSPYKYGILNVKTKETTGAVYNSVSSVKWGLAIVSKVTGKDSSSRDIIKYGVVNYAGVQVLPFEYQQYDLSFSGYDWLKILIVKGIWYEIQNGAVNRTVELNSLSGFRLNSLYKSENYIYGYYDETLYVFDHQFKLIKTFERGGSSYAYSREVFVMGGSKILIQSVYPLPMGTNEKYDFTSQALPFKLKTEIYDLKTQKTKTVECDYLVGGSESDNTPEEERKAYNNSMKAYTVLNISRIVDKTITGLGEHDCTVVVDDKLKILAEIPRNSTTVEKITDDRYFVSGGYEANFIMDKKGEVIAQFGTGYSVSCISDGLMIMYNGSRYGIVDKDGEVLVPFSFYSISNFRGDYAFAAYDYYGNSSVRIDRQGNITPIALSADSYLERGNSGYYVISKYTYEPSYSTKYTMYNYAGNVLLESHNYWPDVWDFGNCLLVAVIDANDVLKYYTIT